MGVDGIFQTEADFRIEDDPPSPLVSGNIIPENNLPINETTFIWIEETVNPLYDDGNHGINLFIDLVDAPKIPNRQK